ncbi:NAD-dependent epimerase/dehydratase family protein [Paenibacillus physcomitrellae]|uniref:UDP-glucose 4-epimerase n=1 Tax=Paenibacillus physcomitrellae TaxID=1619311 RepID=A0ABQ1FYY1_9BACL|nr:NAD-dependent epimerase/dehydratase family protein [Paenibacillus physcomitrellae]GGA33374.1 UDP-glucose 4-epimerase [Paenibacillus physcomitrellae]
MKIVVTGGAGFIGLHTVELLLRQGHEVVVVDDLEQGTRTYSGPRVAFYPLDVGSENLASVFAAEKPEAVIHLAAQVSVQRSLEFPSLDARHNIVGTVNLLKQCVDYNVAKFVFASSAAVYGNASHLPISEGTPAEPLSFYGASKKTAESYIQMFAERYGLNYVILRYANVYGMRQNSKGECSVVASFVKRILEGDRPWINGNGEQTRDFIYVKDVAAANAAALFLGERETLNVGSGRPFSVNELFRLISEICGKGGLEPEFRPFKPGDIQDSLLDNRRALGVLRWEPAYSMLDGLKEMIQYERGLRGEIGMGL